VKRAALVLTFILALLFSTVAGTQLIKIGEADPIPQNPPVNEGEVPPPNGTLPPVISIFAPENNSVYASNNITFKFEVSIPQTNIVYFQGVYYKASWQSNNNSLPLLLRQSIDFKNLPEGPQWIQVYALAGGERATRTVNFTQYYVSYHVTASSIVNFTIDTTPPKVSFLSLEGKTYNTSDVPLSFTASEPVSQIRYSLDEQDNVTAYGNTTLTGLANGAHNVKVYAWDFAGNVGESETIFFSVEVPFPTQFAIALASAIAVVGAGLLVYFTKRRKQSAKPRNN